MIWCIWIKGNNNKKFGKNRYNERIYEKWIYKIDKICCEFL